MTSRSLSRWVEPLHPVRSIKGKLALLVTVSMSAEALLIFWFLTVLHWRARYALTLSVLVTLAVTQVLATGMTRPLREMTAAARAMAAGRSPDPVTTRSRDEVGELARAFNAMAADLQTADAQRRDLMANVAHELRTPLAAVRAQVENLVDGVRVADEAALGEVSNGVERLTDLVENLLSLARAEAGVTPVRRQPVDVAQAVAGAVAAVSPLRPDRRIAVDVAPELVADVDPLRLHQILVNLIDNATRHAPAGGVVQVIGSRHDEALVLEVADDGPGIAPDQRAEVFERFRRAALPAAGEASAVAQISSGGTGLGLAIARWAVHLHGGRIEVAPSVVGCRIRVVLPGEIEAE